LDRREAGQNDGWVESTRVGIRKAGPDKRNPAPPRGCFASPNGNDNGNDPGDDTGDDKGTGEGEKP
jgi:hypothetical protein